MDETGTIRVADTRITLDVLLGYLLDGVKPEQIVSEEWYPMLSLADVHAILGLLLSAPSRVGRISATADAKTQTAARKRSRTTQPTFANVKARLLAGRNAAHAPPAE